MMRFEAKMNGWDFINKLVHVFSHKWRLESCIIPDCMELKDFEGWQYWFDQEMHFERFDDVVTISYTIKSEVRDHCKKQMIKLLKGYGFKLVE